MAKSISVNKKSRGRPKKAGGVDPVSAVRFTTEMTAQIDKWGEEHGIGRSHAIRRLVGIGLQRASPSERLSAAKDFATSGKRK